MKLTCPSCGAVASAEAWENDARWRDVLQVVASLPAPIPPMVIGYLSLFRPGKSALSPKKALRLASELSALVATGHIQVQGKVARPCSPRIWAQGMEQMVERRGSLSLPLPNHNYLRQIVWQLADEADRQQEAVRRDSEAQGVRPKSRNPRPEQGTADGMSEIMRKFNKLEEKK